MKFYRFLPCLAAFLPSIVGNPLPDIDNNPQLEFTEVSSPSFNGHFGSQLPSNEGSTVQVDPNPNLNPLLFPVASENHDSQTEQISQTSIAEEPSPGIDKGFCNDELESGRESGNVNKNRFRRDGAMCAVKEENIDWDSLWETFIKTKAQSNGDAPACTNPSFPLHLCCRGPQSSYVHNRNLFRRVKNCAPCELFFFYDTATR